MRHDSGVTHRGLLVLVVVAAIAAAAMMPVLARATEHARKATCLSHLKQVALACIMYCADYDEVLPAVVADDRDGAAHAATGHYANWTAEPMRRHIKSRYGARYLDGRWMWQLADVLLPAAGAPKGVEPLGMATPVAWFGYIRPADVFDCPVLLREDPSSELKLYIVGLDKNGRRLDPRDPLLDLVAGARHMPMVKVWQSGSYVYMCGHYPYTVGARAADYGSELLSLWDAAHLLGYVDNSADPQQYFACGNSVGVFDDPVHKPLVMCRSFGAHEGNGLDYTNQHVLPLELGGKLPTIPISTPMGFVDGHVKYARLGFYDMLAMIFAPNQIAPAPHPRHQPSPMPTRRPHPRRYR